MKRILCIAAAGWMLAAVSSEAKFRALLVGIDQYATTNAPVEGGRITWTDLNGAVNDVVAAVAGGDEFVEVSNEG